jgi:hypothetical protein
LLEPPAAVDLEHRLGAQGIQILLAEADEIVAGRVRLFGAAPVVLDLEPPGPLTHWTDYERNPAGLLPAGEDIKLTWEPARFGWTFTLGRAYRLSGDERYPQAFGAYLRRFVAANPPYLGPNWMSAQEAALRVLAFTFAKQVFASSPYVAPAQVEQAIAAHAARIPPTLAYARAQGNNHLLSEAAGLYTAGLAREGVASVSGRVARPVLSRRRV